MQGVDSKLPLNMFMKYHSMSKEQQDVFIQLCVLQK